jgi:hypothetical protein
MLRADPVYIFDFEQTQNRLKENLVTNYFLFLVFLAFFATFFFAAFFFAILFHLLLTKFVFESF